MNSTTAKNAQNVFKAIFVLATLILTTSNLAKGELMTKDDMRARDQWVQVWLTKSPSQHVPFSFSYDGKSGANLLKAWPGTEKTRLLDANRIEHTFNWTDPKTGLEVRCVVVLYKDFPVVEWTAYFKNTSQVDTPLLSGIQGIDFEFGRPRRGNFTLHYVEGDATNPGYTPRLKAFDPGATLKFSPAGGRPTSGSFPYYNLESDGGGVIISVGWPGQWASSFGCDQNGSLHVKAGQELTHLNLHPGEEVRSPMIAMEFWKGGDWLRAQNIWRRWMRVHNMPRPGGKEVPLIRAGSKVDLGPNYAINLDNEKDQLAIMDKYFEHGINIKYWWMDIFVGSTNFFFSDEFYRRSGFLRGRPGMYVTGEWKADPKFFPHGLRAVSDHAHSKGAKTIVWYEPEQVWPGEKLYEHKDWLLSAPPDPRVRAELNQYIPLGERRLLNLGNPEALQWLIDHFSSVLAQEDIDVYRQDFNIEPLVFWRYADPPDRQGTTENFYVQGYLRYFQTLIERRPQLLIDTCASGGRRNELETLRLAVPLWRSDTARPALALQNQTYGLALWIPYFGTGVPAPTAYSFRSALGPSLVSFYDVRDEKLDYKLLRRLEAEFWRTAPYFLEDYYPLTEFNPSQSAWMAWQFNRPEQGDGIVQAFRRDKSEKATQKLRLHALDLVGMYEVTDFDMGPSKNMTGRDLMQEGLEVAIKDKPGSAILNYRKISPR
jgi:alpha-galactosidase